MKILLINYRYFVSGGPERYMFNVKHLLETNGHEVIPFSIAYDRNEETPYDSYFVRPIANSDQVYFRDHGTDVKTHLRALERSFYSPTVYRKLESLVTTVKPDVALVLHYLRKLSPSVLKCLVSNCVPFAVRLSDFGMVCPNAHLLRDARPCELCLSGSLRHSVIHRCVQGSRAASAVNYAATRFHQSAGYYRLIPKFIVPSRFTIEKMIEGGWERERFVRIPTPVVSPDELSAEKSEKPLIVYAGRLDPTKGVATLIDAVALLRADPEVPDFSVRVAGDGELEYVRSLHDAVDRKGLGGIEFEGMMSFERLGALLSEAWCSVVPSLWYENVPNSALESMAHGTGLVASGHGSLLELVNDHGTGLVANPGDPKSFADAIRVMISDREGARAIGERARAYVREEHAPDLHYERLINTFETLRGQPQLPPRDKWIFRS